MKNALIQTANESASDNANSNIKKKFTGTDNPRELRAIAALLTRPQPREHLDRAAGCSNAPDLISRLRRYGLEIPCAKIDYIDRDGRITHPGIYHFNEVDRRKVNKWMAERNRDGR
jgi:hypothetical protein